ncbi:hypothetical protein EDD36DRAFT_469284 [Exophiala viscosa]|uniref:Uncharacterized protein n=1 Tax=Exophiala viscosa TaxID=2486360 RepID=A0AAN6DL25_9EURO|nr:hypothetical protein EDD36DRAFT_469284 [Exophiala viscosa]
MSGNQQISSEDAKSVTDALTATRAFGVWGLVLGLGGGLLLGYNMFIDEESGSHCRERELTENFRKLESSFKHGLELQTNELERREVHREINRIFKK